MTTTAPWHQPKCSYCHRPIENADNALATWCDDGDYRSHSPGIIHGGSDACGGYEHLQRQPGYSSLLVTKLRQREPMKPIIIALRHRAADEPGRLVWHSWISIVLGLPFEDGYVPDQIITTEDAAADIAT